jgi:hypothetical protein
MTDNLQQSVSEVDKDLVRSWIDLSKKVRDLSADLKLKAAGTDLSGDASHLSQEASRLCEHVEHIHADVIELLENIETRLPIRDSGAMESRPEPGEIEKESIEIQRESHELRSDFKDIIKALFMWRDDPEERVRERR